MIIPRDRVEETSLHHFTADLAELVHNNIIPERGYPNMVIIRGEGNGQPFMPFAVGEGCAEYRQRFGCMKLTIFND